MIGDVLGADAGEFWLSRDEIYILIKPVGFNRWRRKLDEDVAPIARDSQPKLLTLDAYLSIAECR